MRIASYTDRPCSHADRSRRRHRPASPQFQAELADECPYKASIGSISLRLQELQEDVQAQKIRAEELDQEDWKDVNRLLHHQGLPSIQKSSEPSSLAGITTIHLHVISELRRLVSSLPGNTTGILFAKTSKPMSMVAMFLYHQKRSDTSFTESSNRCRYLSSLERLVDGFCDGIAYIYRLQGTY